MVFSLFNTGLNGKHVEKLKPAGREKDKVRRKIPLLSVHPSIVEAVPGKVQIRHSAQAGVLRAYKHIGDSPPRAPTAHTPGLALWGRR